MVNENVTAIHGSSGGSGGETGFSGGGGSGGSGMDRGYLDARIDAVKAQNDARFAEVLAGIDKINANLSAHGEIVKEKLALLDGDVKSAKAAAESAEQSSNNMRWNIIATAIGVVAVLLAVWAIWAQGIEMVSGLLGAETK